MHSGRWAAAAHLFRSNLAPSWKMLSARRHRADRFDVGKLSTARAFALATAERVLRTAAGTGTMVGPQGLRESSERCRSSRPAPCGAMDGCAGTLEFGWTPYSTKYATHSSRT
eukprot:4704718-Prymnesium_polylepis.1